MDDFWTRLLGQKGQTNPETKIDCEVISKSPAETVSVTATAELEITPEPAVIVSYEKSRLKVATKSPLLSLLKKDLPRGAWVVKHGVMSVAFHYLPGLLRLLKKYFNDRDVVCSGLSCVEELSHLIGPEDRVDVESELDKALKEPVTKHLLDKKEPDERLGIRREIRKELQRDRWIDSIWEKAGKEPPKPGSGWRRVKTDGGWVWENSSGDS